MKKVETALDNKAKNCENLRTIENNTRSRPIQLQYWNAHRTGGTASLMVVEQILDRVSWVLAT